MGKRGQGLVGDFVEAANVPAVLPAELREPHIGAFGDENRRGHPRLVGREPLVFVGRIAEKRHVGVAIGEWTLVPVTPRPLGRIRSWRIELHPDGKFFFAEDISGNLKQTLQAVANKRLPELAYEGKLIAERVWRARRPGRAAGRGGSSAWRREAG